MSGYYVTDMQGNTVSRTKIMNQARKIALDDILAHGCKRHELGKYCAKNGPLNGLWNKAVSEEHDAASGSSGPAPSADLLAALQPEDGVSFAVARRFRGKQAAALSAAKDQAVRALRQGKRMLVDEAPTTVHDAVTVQTAIVPPYARDADRSHELVVVGGIVACRLCGGTAGASPLAKSALRHACSRVVALGSRWRLKKLLGGKLVHPYKEWPDSIGAREDLRTVVPLRWCEVGGWGLPPTGLAAAPVHRMREAKAAGLRVEWDDGQDV